MSNEYGCAYIDDGYQEPTCQYCGVLLDADWVRYADGTAACEACDKGDDDDD